MTLREKIIRIALKSMEMGKPFPLMETIGAALGHDPTRISVAVTNLRRKNGLVFRYQGGRRYVHELRLSAADARVVLG